MNEALPSRMLPATDGSQDAQLAARAAADLSKGTGAELHVVSEVAEEGSEPSLVVVGSWGLCAIEQILLGSVSMKALRAARVPVLVCPHGKCYKI